MLIFGWKSWREFVTWTVPYHCGRCRNTGHQALMLRRFQFSLFFIPVLRLRRGHLVACQVCGAAADVDADYARRTVEYAVGSELHAAPIQAVAQ